jgi:hypothetical protein
MSRNTRREEAIKREKRKKRIIVGAIVAAAFLIAVLIILGINQQSQTRVYTDGDQTVTLYDNGNFAARLFHNAGMDGTYTESTIDGETTVSFTYGGTTSVGRIEENVLMIPDEWDDGHGHGHGTGLTLISGRR